MKFRPVPQPTANQIDINRAVKENLESLAGLRGEKLRPLPATATLAEVITAYNALLERVQA
jgi:fructose-1,6-bisphosphatase/sedoheptulose 1,7-bisphosphatase-like protein